MAIQSKRGSTAMVMVFLFLSALVPLSSSATSGACSSHSGVDCARGMQSDGKVYCNDGWTESTTYYEYTAECQDSSSSVDIVYKQLQYDGKIVPSTTNIDYRTYKMTESCPGNSTREIGTGGMPYCKCNGGYYNYQSNNLALGGTCTKGEPFVHMVISGRKASDKTQDLTSGIERTNATCKNKYINSYLDGKGDCQCETGYRWIYDAYDKIVLCVKRDDYEEVVKNTPVKNPGMVQDKPKQAEPADSAGNSAKKDTEAQTAPEPLSSVSSSDDSGQNGTRDSENDSLFAAKIKDAISQGSQDDNADNGNSRKILAGALAAGVLACCIAYYIVRKRKRAKASPEISK